MLAIDYTMTTPVDENDKWRSSTDHDAFRHSFSECDDEGEAYKLCLAYASKISEMLENGIGLRLHGEVGTGKTFFASCIASYLHQVGYQLDWIDCKSFIAQMADWKTAQDTKACLSRMTDAPILFIDDFDTKKMNALELSCLFRLINAREDRLTVITTNMTPASITNGEAQDMDEKRVLSRIQSLCPVAVVLNGEDRRKEVAQSKRSLAQSIMKGGID